MILTNPPRQRTFGHNCVQPDWVNLTLPYIANYFPDSKIIDNSQRYFTPELKGDVAISIRSEREYPCGLEMIKRFNIILAGGQSADYHRKELESMGVKVVKQLDEGMKLDDTPFPRWDLAQLVKSKYFKGRNVGSIEMSRGCPYSCDFCATTTFWEKFRQKSNDRILEELQYLKSSGRTHVYLTDDSFGLNTNKHIALLEKIISKDLNMKFFTQIRADTVAENPELVRFMKKAGFYGVLIGFDTYDNIVFSGENKLSSAETNRKSSAICRENKIAIYGCHIFGLPSQEMPEDFEDTFTQGRRNSDLFVMSFFSPLPNTKSADKSPIRNNEWHRKHTEYYRRHQFSFDEIFLTLTHPNPIIRRMKRGGYKKYFNYKLRGLK